MGRFKKISTVVEDQFPEHIQKDHPLFVDFLKAYYDWLDQESKDVDMKSVNDVDKTIDEFIQVLRRQFLLNFPQADDLVDDINEKTLIKRIGDFYAKKGTPDSFKFLFRILFNENVEIFLPKTNILRASDGKWQSERVLKVSADTGDPFDLQNKFIVQPTTGARAAVEEVTKISVLTFDVYRLVLDKETVSGTFSIESGEIEQENGTIVVDPFASVVDVDITDPGTGYNPGDPIRVVGGTGGGTIVVVRSVIEGAVEDVVIVDSDAGSGYQVGDRLVFFNEGTTGQLAAGFVSSTGSGGSIVSIMLEFGGFNYRKRPGVTTQRDLDDPDRTGIATLRSISSTIGGVESVNIISSGAFLVSGEDLTIGTTWEDEDATWNETTKKWKDVPQPWEDIITAWEKIITVWDELGGDTISKPTVLAERSGDENAAGAAVMGAVSTVGSIFRNEDGHLSSTKVLQDNNFWQIFSYMLISQRTVDEFRRIVMRLVHPAGMKLLNGRFIIPDLDPLTFDMRFNSYGYAADISGKIIENYEDFVILDDSGVSNPPSNNSHPNTENIAGIANEFLLLDNPDNFDSTSFPRGFNVRQDSSGNEATIAKWKTDIKALRLDTINKFIFIHGDMTATRLDVGETIVHDSSGDLLTISAIEYINTETYTVDSVAGGTDQANITGEHPYLLNKTLWSSGTQTTPTYLFAVKAVDISGGNTTLTLSSSVKGEASDLTASDTLNRVMNRTKVTVAEDISGIAEGDILSHTDDHLGVINNDITSTGEIELLDTTGSPTGRTATVNSIVSTGEVFEHIKFEDFIKSTISQILWQTEDIGTS